MEKSFGPYRGISPIVLISSPCASDKPRLASSEDALAEITFAWASARADGRAAFCSNSASDKRAASVLTFRASSETPTRSLVS
jgi:hypothetical protein